MKQLIEDANKDVFNQFIDVALSHENGETENVMRGEMASKLLLDTTESKNFKAWLYAGYIAMLMGTMRGDDVEFLHADRVMIGFALGFKYAMYLHEQRELVSFNTEVTEKFQTKLQKYEDID